MSDILNRADIVLRRTLRVLMPDGTIESMNLEEYLRGVVPHEIGAARPPEALKAQAVAARCYALTSRRHLDVGADICTTTHCQVWKPQTDPRSDDAIAGTAGVVAVHQNSVINAFFFAHCTGHTKNIEDVWDAPAVPYLRGVSCPASFADLSGHGVGLCQEGAIEFGRQGRDFDEILRHFYTGVEVVRGSYDDATVEAPEPEAIVGRYRVDIERRPGVRRILGTFPTDNVHFSVGDESGNRATLYSGIDPTVGAGGWSLAAWRDGVFTITVEDQEVPVEVQGDQVVVTFIESAGDTPLETARVVSQTMTRTNADQLLEDIAWYDTYESVFTIEPAPAGSWALLSTERFSSRRAIAGDLGVHGVTVVVADGSGNSVTTASGTASAYGEGGFSVPVWRDDTFIVTVEERVFQVEVNGDHVVLTLRRQDGESVPEAVRLVSEAMPTHVAAEVVAGLNDRFPGVFRLLRDVEP